MHHKPKVESLRCRPETAEDPVRRLPSHGQASAELAEAQKSIAAMITKHQVEDEAIQLWYDAAPQDTPTDCAYRSAEILNHDRDQAIEATMVFRQAANVAQRAGHTTLAIELERQAAGFRSDLQSAELGLSDLQGTLRRSY